MYKIIGQQILFIYETSLVVDRLQMYTQYPVRSVASTEKAPVDKQELIITNDELVLIYSECDRAIEHVFQIAYKLSFDVPNALLKNKALQISINEEAEEGTPEGDSIVPATNMVVYGFRILNKNAYNKNLLPMVDTAIEEIFITSVLLNWFTITRQFDFVKVFDSKLRELKVQYNNALGEFYKPLILSSDITPVFTQEVIEVDEEGEITVDDSVSSGGTTVPAQTNEVYYYNNITDRPAVGTVDIIYVDRSTKQMYSWSGTEYVLYSFGDATFEYEFFDTAAVIVSHNLGVYLPLVQMVDYEGNEWEIDVQPMTINTTLCQWNGNKTGKLYFSI